MTNLPRRAFLTQTLFGMCAAGGLGAACSSSATWSRLFSFQRPPTIVLITLDTTRADHLGCYGYSRQTSPQLDRLANEAVVYERAISPATWTLPAHASLFTGKFAATHGVCKAADGALDLAVPYYGPDDVNHYRAHPLADEERTLAAILTDAGYSTAAVVAGPWLKQVFGMNRGFQVYDDEHIETINARRAEEVTDRALELIQQPSRQPRFLFLNYFDAHYPYQPPEGFGDPPGWTGAVPPDEGLLTHAVDRTTSMYDAEIRYMDFHLGRLFDGLRRQGLYDDAWIIVTADHGELLGEHHSFGHPGFVFQEAVHIPLIVKEPRAHGTTGRLADRVQLLDVFPLVLTAAQVPVPEGIQGEMPGSVTHPIIVESRTLPGINSGGDWYAILEEEWKFVWNSETNHMLFNLTADPREEHNLFAQNPERARALDDKLHEYLTSLPSPGSQLATVIDKRTEAQLRSIGYLR